MKIAKISLLLLPLMLVGCSDDDNDNDDNEIITTATYQLSLTNLTNGQPMSPIAAYLHDGTVSAWQIGMPASIGIEMLAESGDGTMWLTEATNTGAQVTGSGEGILMPGMAQTVNLTVASEDPLYLSLATMLVNTNDAFTGAAALHLQLAVGQTASGLLPVMDAGTEANSELASTIPGPAGGGTGFDEARDDIGDYVARHGGIVGYDDGKIDSALNHQHRFNSPVAHWRVTRLE